MLFYVGFLMLKESDIHTLENVKVGDRKRLIMCQADLHKADWSKSSLPSIDHTHRQRRGAAVPAAGPGAGRRPPHRRTPAGARPAAEGARVLRHHGNTETGQLGSNEGCEQS